MGKRKREPYVPPSEHTPAHTLYVQRLDLERKLSHGKKRLNQVLKTAKGFERQKLAKRITAATKDAGEDAVAGEDKIGRLERELVVVKALDLPELAESHLRKSIGKLKGASTSPALPVNFIHSTTNGTIRQDESAEAVARNNVTARLLNAKVVKLELAKVLEGIVELLGLEDGTKKGQQSKATAVDEMDLDATGETLQDDSRQGGQDETLESDWEGFDTPQDADGNNHLAVADGGDDEEDGDDYARYETRLASSSDEDEQDDADIHLPTPRLLSNPTKQPYDPVLDLSLSPSPSERSSSSPPPPPPTSKSQSSRPTPLESKAKQSKPTTSKPNSTFLPSLTLGGFWSGSESEPEDASRLDIEPPRKNRRGQRARQAIWEQKFGKGANHVKKQTKEEARDKGWDAKRGATGSGERRGAWKATGANTTVAPPRRDTTAKEKEKQEIDKKPIHPSWAAAKKVKEQKRGVKFEGKKVVFD